MDESVVSEDTGHKSHLEGAPDTLSKAPSCPIPPSNHPARPCRPKSLHPSAKLAQLPSRPPSLPPPLPPVSKHPPPKPSNPPPLSFHPAPSLPPPLSPTPAPPTSLSPQSNVSSDLTPSFSSCAPPLSPAVSTPSPLPQPPPVIPPVSPAPTGLSSIDRLVKSKPVWHLKGLSQDQANSIMEDEKAGAFLVRSTEDNAMELSVRLPDEPQLPHVHTLMVKPHKTSVYLEGSLLFFDDILKLISFYCASRDILAIQLRLPRAITKATKREELEVISAMGADFWMSDLNQRAKEQDLFFNQNSPYLYINPVNVEDSPNNDPNLTPISTLDIITKKNMDSTLQNGVDQQLGSPEEKICQTKSLPNQAIKYKRPPPRPPSLGPGSGMGPLFSSNSSPNTSSSITSSAAIKEEGKGGSGGEREERKSVSTSPTPSRPPVPHQSQADMFLPAAPLRCTSSRKCKDPDVGEGTEREKGQNQERKSEKKGGDRGKDKIESKSGLLGEGIENHNGGQNLEEFKIVRKKAETEEKEGKEGDGNKSGSRCPPLVKKPSRPVPPPRRTRCAPGAPVGSKHAGEGSTYQSVGMRVPPPSGPLRPDVSLYSPQGGAVMVPDTDSCSASSTEEEVELNQEQEQNHSCAAESRSPKAAVKRTPTTIMLDRARYRLSTVLTGLISHDRRLTQRIVELARDPLSYFGNLVKEHRAFTLETMSNHSSATELLQEIRQMMTQLKIYLLQSAELQAMLEPQHQYGQDKLGSIAEAALCKSVLKPLREPIYQRLEKLHTNDNSLKQLSQNQSAVLGNTTTALGITTSVPEASAMEKISLKLNNLHLEYSPQKKIDHLLKACKIIYDSMSISSPGRAHGADDFLPVMMYVLARSNLSALQMDVEYMMELMDPSLTIGEGSYYLTTTYGALEHIKTFDQHRSTTRQLSREVQDSIHRWERRRTLNQECTAQGSVQDFLTVCCPEIGTDPRTLGVSPTTTIEQLAEHCAARFEQDSCTLSVYIDGVQRPLAPTELALSVKNSGPPGAYCFVYHPIGNPMKPPAHSCPLDLPPAPPQDSLITTDESAEAEVEEKSLISL